MWANASQRVWGGGMYQRLKLRHVNALLAVAEHGSIVLAAQALAVTQPAVSKAIRELEGIVGQTLLNRTSRGVELTSAGRSEEHTSELQSRENLVCRLLLENKNTSVQ